MTYLLDTNIVSELRKGVAANPRVSAWFAGLADEDVYLSVLVVGEIRYGIEAIRRREPRRVAPLEQWLARLVRDHGGRILPVDRPVAEEWGRLRSLRTGSVVDLLLVATARVHGLTLATRNVGDVAWTGVSYVDPFSPD